MALTDDRGPAFAPSDPGPGDPGPRSEFDRQPPQDLAAEQSVLGGMLLSKDAIADVIEAPGPDDFYRLLATATNIGWLSTMCDNVGHGCNGSRFTCPAG